jgi:tRNA(Ile)-lysidine synthetase-like protein
MTMLHYLNNVSNVSNLYAIHIIYNNRKESELEFNFVSNFCKRIGITLYYYRVEWLKREYTERDFYEKITRQIRFSVYKAICEIITNSIVLLGHIKEDVVENIWTNISKCQSISNLKKMLDVDNQLDVNIGRPLLNVSKNDIYLYSKIFDIPYLKNTTPSWSNRGKFRERFYDETHLQFGESVDDRIIQFSSILEKQSNVLEKLIYKYIMTSYNKDDKSFDITRAVDSELDIDGWSVLFERICHNYIFCKKPSIHSIKNFVDRLNTIIRKKTNINLFKIQLGKNLVINIKNENIVWKMLFIL